MTDDAALARELADSLERTLSGFDAVTMSAEDCQQLCRLLRTGTWQTEEQIKRENQVIERGMETAFYEGKRLGAEEMHRERERR